MTNMVHPSEIRPFHGALMRSTALTQHKSKGLMIIVAVAAMVFIPWAAPLIASAIAGSFGLVGAALATATTYGAALVGAGLGAGFAAIQGGNVALGALGGAISGGIAGANYNPGLGVGDAAGGFTPGTASSPGFGSDAIGYGSSGVNVGSPEGLISGGTADVAVGEPGYGEYTSSPEATFDTSAGQSFDVQSDGSSYAGEFDAPTSTGGQTFNIQDGAPTTGGPSTVAPAGTGQSFSDSVSGFFDKNPKLTAGLKQSAGKFATRALSNAIVGDTPDMSDEERQLLADNEAARKQQQALLTEKRSRSAGLLRQAENINPRQKGQEALTDEQNRLGRSQQAGLRNISPSQTGLRANTLRRNALDKARLSGFRGGFDRATDRRIKLTQAAINTAPSGDNIGASIRADQMAADRNFQRLKGERQNVANILGPVISASLGYETEEEKKKKKLKAGG